jgi:hypothetical protein
LTKVSLVHGLVQLDGIKPVHQGSFTDGIEIQTIRFAPAKGRFICLQAMNSHPRRCPRDLRRAVSVGCCGSFLSEEPFRLRAR